MTLPVATESQLQVQLAQYLCRQYPDIEFHSDFGSGAVLSARQASIQLQQNGYRRGYPDLFIAKPKILLLNDEKGKAQAFIAGGLFLELKKAGKKLYKKDGSLASRHIAEQADRLGKLRQAGYIAEFAIGFDQAKEKIDAYLALDDVNKDGFDEISLCEQCYCMTHTRIDGACGKCGAKKERR